MNEELTPLEALTMLLPLIIKYPLFQKNYDVIETALRALEIIKVFFKGRFSLHEKKCMLDKQGNYDLIHFISFDNEYSHIRYPISQKEFDLLKEVLL